MKKNTSLSAIRFIAMLLIITCHILQGLKMQSAFWFNVGVQIFFFLSGFLYGKKEIKDIMQFYKSRLKKVFLPFLILLIIMYIIEKYILHNQYSTLVLLGNMIGLGGFCGTLLTLSHTWFISYILVCYLVTPILQSIFKENNNNVRNLILLVLLLQSFQLYNVITLSAPFIINYILGYFYSRICNTQKSKRTYEVSVYVSTILILPLNIILQENLNWISLPLFLTSQSNVVCNWGHVLLGSSIFIILYNLFEKINIKDNFVLRFSDKYSLFIYLVHQIFILNQFSMLHLTDNLVINIILIFISSFAFGIILHYLYNLLLKLGARIANKFNIIVKKNV